MRDSRIKTVTLKSHDFTGLGFNICGNMRDGIFVKDILHRGPAFESGCINTGKPYKSRVAPLFVPMATKLKYLT
ncbi:hypothetical protein Phum_PHUM436590 [Pediculus humanus corporis]|uniref:PDZ domain-containing protein n=1 Tax=Pediculus humanus subsp. corporis TaxID=121224 RepID=E0VTR4_PEDHC|nr:uncharacterized protein Phum_PHUM436590 [Pediculus humanus corporis]EEB16770.1 hypothetical protein Phum_PHUM436590 [Pediculus humanus corporis]